MKTDFKQNSEKMNKMRREKGKLIDKIKESKG